MADSIQKVSNFVSFTESSNPSSLTNVNNTLYFTANDGTTGNELWRINSSGNAEQVADINPGSSGSSKSNLTAFGEKIYVTASDGNAFQIWSLGQSAPSITSVSTDDRGYQQGENLDFTGTFSLDSGSAVLPVTWDTVGTVNAGACTLNYELRILRTIQIEHHVYNGIRSFQIVEFTRW